MIIVSYSLTAFIASILSIIPSVFIALNAEKGGIIYRFALMVFSFVVLSLSIFCILSIMFLFL